MVESGLSHNPFVRHGRTRRQSLFKKRLHDFELFQSTATAISATMTVYMNDLGCSGPWQTGVDADDRNTFSGHHHQS